jgi:hypothetical protein
MKKLFIFLCVVTLGLTSCTKTEVFTEDLTTDVVFTPLLVDNQSFKSTINRETLGEDFVTISINSMEITAEQLQSGYSVTEDFIFVDDGSGENIMRMENVALGRNLFTARTTSSLNVPDGYNKEVNGVVGGWRTNGYPFTGTEKESDSVVKALRSIPPYVEFVGKAFEDIQFEGCADGSCNEVELDMKAQQGRLIITVEFEDNELANTYFADVYTTQSTNSSDYKAVSHIGIKTLENYGDEYCPIAWFYLSNENANDSTEVVTKIELKELYPSKTLRSWTISSKEFPELTGVEPGVDRWLKIVITEDALTSNCTNLDFDWEWEESNEVLHVGDENDPHDDRNPGQSGNV